MNQNLKQSLNFISESKQIIMHKISGFHSDEDLCFGILACNIIKAGSSDVLKDHTTDMEASFFCDMTDLCPTFQDHYTTSKYQAQHL
jgi:hypothetical protein